VEDNWKWSDEADRKKIRVLGAFASDHSKAKSSSKWQPKARASVRKLLGKPAEAPAPADDNKAKLDPKEALEKLRLMGFTEEASKTVLVAESNNFEKAVNKLLSMGDSVRCPYEVPTTHHRTRTQINAPYCTTARAHTQTLMRPMVVCSAAQAQRGGGLAGPGDRDGGHGIRSRARCGGAEKDPQQRRAGPRAAHLRLHRRLVHFVHEYPGPQMCIAWCGGVVCRLVLCGSLGAFMRAQARLRRAEVS
jgi:hypothetical protein